MNGLRQLNAIYTKSYAKRPILTLCVVNGILGATSDGLAQTIGHYNSTKLLPDKVKEHQDRWEENTSKWDYMRTLRFAAYNFCVAPLGGKWYIFLDKYFPMPVITNTVSKAVQNQLMRQSNKMAIKRMVTDQMLFAPAGLVVFFTAMGFSEGGGWDGVKEKFRDAYAPALIANYKIWPLVQLVNFKFMPLQYRLPFVSSLGVLWNAYLSWLNNASKMEEVAIKSIESEKDITATASF
ncbi:hypothetical protein BDB01DRAFT_771437 [Pilobolus umbonatus]|nr:hypothetical protein BDB01DRAFT_771437 [Pilobolus umbonatus]